MDFDSMTEMQRRLHNAACVIEAEGDEHGFAKLQRDAIAEIERLRAALAKANEQAERFERGWYLRGDVLEQARGALQKTMGAWGGTCAWHADVKAAISAIDAGFKA